MKKLVALTVVFFLTINTCLIDLANAQQSPAQLGATFAKMQKIGRMGYDLHRTDDYLNQQLFEKIFRFNSLTPTSTQDEKVKFSKKYSPVFESDTFVNPPEIKSALTQLSNKLLFQLLSGPILALTIINEKFYTPQSNDFYSDYFSNEDRIPHASNILYKSNLDKIITDFESTRSKIVHIDKATLRAEIAMVNSHREKINQICESMAKDARFMQVDTATAESTNLTPKINLNVTNTFIKNIPEDQLDSDQINQIKKELAPIVTSNIAAIFGKKLQLDINMCTSMKGYFYFEPIDENKVNLAYLKLKKDIDKNIDQILKLFEEMGDFEFSKLIIDHSPELITTTLLTTGTEDDMYLVNYLIDCVYSDKKNHEYVTAAMYILDIATGLLVFTGFSSIVMYNIEKLLVQQGVKTAVTKYIPGLAKAGIRIPISIGANPAYIFATAVLLDKTVDVNKKMRNEKIQNEQAAELDQFVKSFMILKDNQTVRR